MATAVCVCTDEREGPHVQLIKGRGKGRVNFFLFPTEVMIALVQTGNKISAVVCVREREGDSGRKTGRKSRFLQRRGVPMMIYHYRINKRVLKLKGSDVMTYLEVAA